jgi:predicted nuclease of predicted toxin-antitoxin system
VKILLDENVPESVRHALLERGHEADSVTSLRLKGLDNGSLYHDVAQRYDLCFSKDRAFVDGVRAIDRPGAVKVLRITIRQAPAPEFTARFIRAFEATDWSRFRNGSDWPDQESA